MTGGLFAGWLSAGGPGLVPNTFRSGPRRRLGSRGFTAAIIPRLVASRLSLSLHPGPLPTGAACFVPLPGRLLLARTVFGFPVAAPAAGVFLGGGSPFVRPVPAVLLRGLLPTIA
ncbi:MAG: hypothetical protein EBZ59_02620 [Planctomycetia bacterium]|nr:hypothetical protein [Planctomycetia bacterium]